MSSLRIDSGRGCKTVLETDSQASKGQAVWLRL